MFAKGAGYIRFIKHISFKFSSLHHLPGDFGDVIAVICAAATSRTSEKGNDIFGINGAPR